MKATLATAGFAALALCLMAPSPAAAKTRKMKSCANAEATLMATGQGDRDSDGLSDCREMKQLGTSPTNPDTDGDGVSDAQEISDHTDPLDADTDGDGMNDHDDSAPRIQQRLKVFVDVLICPEVGVPGSLSALGMSVTVDDMTVFEDGPCADLAALVLAPPAGTQVFAEVDVVEGSTGIVTATKVESEDAEED
jgi:hypothetical protein